MANVAYSNNRVNTSCWAKVGRSNPSSTPPWHPLAMPKKPSPTLTRFATMLRSLRTVNGGTQAEVAAAIGIGRSTLATYESGADVPGRDTLAAIATYYKVSLSDLWPAGGPTSSQPGVPQFVDDPDELALLDFWRTISPPERVLFLRMLRPDAAAAA